jgi:hypothetical protein
MSRARRGTTTQIGVLPSPAWTFELLTGHDPHCRLPGWPAQFQQQLGEPDATAVWSRSHEALIALARAHDFEPYWLTKRRPIGAAFEAWRNAFLAAHRY